MLQTFVIGLGRAGAGLHVSVLSRLRERSAGRQLFAEEPLVVCDPRFASSGDLDDVFRRWDVRGRDGQGTVLIDSVAQAGRLLDPERTVVHVCTPPAVRLEIIEQLARDGFRKILVEKPLALDERTLADLERVRNRWSLHLVVVAQWLVSALTVRLQELAHSTALGELRSLSFLQRKPRFSRSLATHGHPTAFDVELPHSVGVALRLAGGAGLSDAACTDMAVGDTIIPRMGGARLTLQHDCGVRTEIISDLTSPVRQRRVVLQFDRGLAIGHYPGSQDDDHAQLRIMVDGQGPSGAQARSVFPDDALTTFLLRAYQRFSASERDEDDFAVNAAGVRLLCAAKRWRTAW
ncbi:MAG: oxidoreductase [Pseudonocardiaceae bacterium]